eukprot:9661464-Heterocapsa_arctica.AAC.1
MFVLLSHSEFEPLLLDYRGYAGGSGFQQENPGRPLARVLWTPTSSAWSDNGFRPRGGVG